MIQTYRIKHHSVTMVSDLVIAFGMGKVRIYSVTPQFMARLLAEKEAMTRAVYWRLEPYGA